MDLYFDYAASTPIDRRVRAAMEPYLRGKFGNPGSLHAFGQEAIAAVDRARETIAASLGAGFREIVFTGSATEANNLAIRGVIRGLRIQNTGYRRSLNAQSSILNPHIIVSAIEHESVLETARDMEREGAEVTYLPVSRDGFVDIEKLKRALHERTVLVSVMYANNEVGTIQPIGEIAKIISDFRMKRNFSFGAALRPSGHGARRASEGAAPERLLAGQPSGSRKENLFSYYPLFHTDAVQAFQFLDCNVHTLGVDFMTLSAHKIYGPKGIGALYVRNRGFLTPIITGGGQEFGLRSGTENVPSLVGFAKAVQLAVRSRPDVSRRLQGLRNYLVEGIRNFFPSLEVNGMRDPRLPNIINVYFPGNVAEDLLTRWDISGLLVSSGSACRTRSALPSNVLKALGVSPKRARGSVRFSLGSPTTRREVDRTLQIIKISLREKP